jgi:ABC-2 type transport system permease protein
VADNQMVAAIVSSSLVIFLLVCWLLARVMEPPLADVVAHLALFDKHYQPFMRGMVHSRDIVYYGAVTYFFLLLAVHTSRLRKWS